LLKKGMLGDHKVRSAAWQRGMAADLPALL
jgi:hypothetical protein